MPEYIFVYQTICEVNNKSYIGVHRTKNINDGYIGGGIRSESTIGKEGQHKKNNQFHNAVRKYGYNSFKRYELDFFDTYEEALMEEKRIVDLKWVKSKDNYNSALGGRGSTHDWMSDEQRQAIREKYKGELNHRYGKMAENAKKVIQYNLQGEEIGRYISATDAAIKLNLIGSNVSACCLGRYSQSGGFVFRYEKYTEKERGTLNKNLSLRKREYKEDGTWAMNESHKEYLKTITRKKYNRTVSQETKDKQRAAKLGVKRIPHSEETKRKIGSANKGIKHSKESLINFSNGQAKYKKAICQYDLNGNVLFQYESIREACRVGGFDRWALKKCVAGTAKTHSGYVFKYKEEGGMK